MNRILSILCLLTLVFTVSVSSRDMMERPTAVVPGESPRGFALLPAGYADTSYVAHSLRSGEYDSFWISSNIHFAVLDLLKQRVGLYYTTYLFSGPVDDPSRQGSDLAPWLMNAVQYEYGISWRYAPDWMAGTRRLPVSLELVGDYGRRSFHPFRRGFADPASDILRGGVSVSDIAVGTGTLDTLLRMRWSRLFGFWGTDIADPRATWAVQPAFEYRGGGIAIADAGRLGLFILGAGDLLFVDESSLDGDFSGELGVFLETGAPGRGSAGTGPRQRLEVYVNGYHSGDTEERPDEAYTATLLGFGARFSIVW